MNDIQVFNFEHTNVRTFVDENGQPWFCAKDVCDVLGYGNAREAVRKHTANTGVSKRDTPTSGGIQKITYIDERNLYRLIMRSKLPKAEEFQDWVCGDVIPTIRKTGTYGQPQYQIPQTYAAALRLAADLEEKNQRLENKIEQDKPLVEFARDIKKTDNDFLIRNAAKMLGVGVKFLFDYLRQESWIMKKSEPYARRVHQGLMTVKVGNYEDSDGEQKCSITGCLTFKGLQKLHSDLKGIGKIPHEHQLELDL